MLIKIFNFDGRCKKIRKLTLKENPGDGYLKKQSNSQSDIIKIV